MGLGPSQSRDSSTVGPAKLAAVGVIVAAISAGVTFSVMRQPQRTIRDPEVVYVLPPAPIGQGVKTDGSQEALESQSVQAVPNVRAAEERLEKIEPAPVAEPEAVDEPERVVETPPARLGKMNVNTASEAELQLLPDVGPKMAKAIADYRKANGPFKSIAELDKVKGIGERTLKRLAPLVTVD